MRALRDVRRRGVVAGRELLDERTLRVGQLGRDVHVDMGDEIAALAGLAQLGDAQVLQDIKTYVFGLSITF